MKTITIGRCVLPRDYQQDEPAYHCAECGAELYRYNVHFIRFGEIICQTCMEEIINDGTL